MLKTKQSFISVGLFISACIFFAVLSFFLTRNTGFLFSFITASLIVCIVFTLQSFINRLLRDFAEKKTLYRGETGLLSAFIERLRFSYTLDDFIHAVCDVCEDRGGIAVLYVDKSENRILYSSPSHLASGAHTFEKLSLNFNPEWKDGYYFFDGNLGLVSDTGQARGFFLVSNRQHVFFFCRYTRLFDPVIFPRLLEEFQRFQLCEKTIVKMSEISSLSKEWSLLADTQKSFLPQTMPKIKKLDIAAYYRPLVNVSGDYYTVLPITPEKTLIMLGDVSGKGLAAALIMGLVMNTVKILREKENLSALISSVDKAIKSMNLEDKYTVMFIGLIDTQKMTVEYINASMADPVIISRSPDGGRLRFLKSNASLVGIIEMDEIEPAVQKLYTGDVLLVVSDGVSEVMNEKGIELGNTEQYERLLKKSFVKSARSFITDISNLVFSYSGTTQIRDDITMLAVKIGEAV
ncbi:SpoIIE family protein phosphatase [Treponema sp. OMZ 840]|uniref:PP2C family protein-serine/threonine phosphatase n=1 Tax=Treponema sp. OMZ 840 TaxID=244313 RepID=UPI003D90E17A